MITRHHTGYILYRNIKSWYCAPGIGQLYFKHAHNKKKKKGNQICGDERKGRGEGVLDESGERYELPVTRQITTGI